MVNVAMLSMLSLLATNAKRRGGWQSARSAGFVPGIVTTPFAALQGRGDNPHLRSCSRPQTPFPARIHDRPQRRADRRAIARRAPAPLRGATANGGPPDRVLAAAGYPAARRSYRGSAGE